MLAALTQLCKRECGSGEDANDQDHHDHLDQREATRPGGA
jgi:hypothetical protein